MVYRKVLSVREQITQIRCKGTTKNAHTQVKWAFFWKIIDFNLLNMPFTFMTEACLWEWRVSGIFRRRSRIFQKKGERRWSMYYLIGLPQSTWLCGKRRNGGNLNEQSEFFVASQFRRRRRPKLQLFFWYTTRSDALQALRADLQAQPIYNL